ncbi:periodic tryptophan protein 1 [[Candida] railenensis]|uniref:Periodic tryptophan protein 1 n=1 Tax=[Candida] railenensis TaxID=45579 RepID=A0A9P0QNC9_9ASCO|nr:periodic tryptophan protein 1 [[Candida] railenensis]
MISSTCWVPRGYASEFPEKYELDDAEMERINAMANLQLNERADEDLDEDEEVDEDEEETKSNKLTDQIDQDDDLKEYDLENYDNDTNSDQVGQQVTIFPGLSTSDAAIYGEEGEDQYLSLPTEEDDKEEKLESQIYPTDNLVLATRTEDDISYLDVYVYDDGAGAPEGADEEEEDKFDADVAKGLVRESNLYVHHDIMLPSFPLCVEWINYKPGNSEGAASGEDDKIGNFAAIGTFDPQIEIWNLDCMDKAFPDIILGEAPDQSSVAGLKKKNKKGKKKKSAAHVTTHHTDAVLSLAHNRVHRSVLASTSADNTVKLWDLNNGTAVRSLNTIHNNKKVSSSQWHSQEASILLTGGYDGSCGVSDVRISEVSSMTKNYQVSPGEEIESVRWGHSSQPELFYAGTDNGNVYCFDVRVVDKPVWTLHAHDVGISSLDVNNYLPGMITTAAMGEKTVKLWKCPTAENKKGPSMVLSRDFGVGNVLASSFANDIEVAGNMVIGGVSGALKMWDAFSNRSVRSSFRDELRDLQKKARYDAREAGRASRIARKYNKENSGETVMTVEAGGLDDESDSDSGELEGMEDDEEED